MVPTRGICRRVVCNLFMCCRRPSLLQVTSCGKGSLAALADWKPPASAVAVAEGARHRGASRAAAGGGGAEEEAFTAAAVSSLFDK